MLVRLDEKTIVDPTSIDTIETMNGSDEMSNNESDHQEQSAIVANSSAESSKDFDISPIDSDMIIPNKKTDLIYFASEQGSSDSKKATVTYSFEYCDHLINIAPCGYGIVGEDDSDETHSLQRQQFHNLQTTVLDFLTTSGTNQSGSVSVLQQTIKPQLITSHEIRGSIDMWTVSLAKNDEDHAFILISQEKSTLILQTGSEITQLQHSGFLTNEQTIYCGNIGDNCIVQVTRSNIVLLHNTDQLQIIAHEQDPIRYAISLNHYLAILTIHGVVQIYELQPDPPKLNEFTLLNDRKSIAINLYADQSGLFTTTITNPNQFHSNVSQSPKQQISQASVSSLAANALVSEDLADDDEEAWLYGGKSAEKTSKSTDPESMDTNRDPTTAPEASTIINNQAMTSTVPVTYWLSTIGKDGMLIIYELKPDENQPLRVRFETERFNNASKILVDVQDSNPPLTSYLGKIDTSCTACVHEILFLAFGPKKNRVYLIVTNCESMVINTDIIYACLGTCRR